MMTGESKRRATLKHSGGVSPPGALSSEAISRLKRARKGNWSIMQMVDGIRNGDIPTLSRAITLVESALTEHQAEAQKLISACLPYSGSAFRLGITGVPGAGKSTFIEALGKHILEQGNKLAVLAIDPSSERSGGSIMGDKTRMEGLAGSREVYIRPSPSGGTLGGVARKTREAIILCEAAGFDTLIIETVGVGQSETAVHSMVDFFLLIMLPGSGDELQGIKRGIMEMADGIAINKADGNNIQKARRAQDDFTNALHLFPPSVSGWVPQVRTCSSINHTGIKEIWSMIGEFRETVTRNGSFALRRTGQSKYWMYETIRNGIYQQVFSDPVVRKELEDLEKSLADGKITPFMAAATVLNRYK